MSRIDEPQASASHNRRQPITNKWGVSTQYYLIYKTSKEYLIFLKFKWCIVVVDNRCSQVVIPYNRHKRYYGTTLNSDRNKSINEPRHVISNNVAF